MSDQDKGSAKPFRYRNSLENKIGKYIALNSSPYKPIRRTGAVVRKSDISKNFDGLLNLNDYFETNTDKLSVTTTDDFESSITSDIHVGN